MIGKIPVYMITGFLEGGKTTFMNEVLLEGEFSDGQPALLIACEDGEVEYDRDELLKRSIALVTVEEEEEFNNLFLQQQIKKYRPKKVFIEMNGMWDSKWMYEPNAMPNLELVQVISIIDGSTFPVYLSNMRSILSNLFQFAEMVIFNRCTEQMDLHSYRRTIRGLNPAAMVYFEGEDGEPIDPGMEEPPYDLNAPVIQVEDMDYGLWFLDVSDNPDRYDGKKVRFLAKVMKSRRLPQGCIIPGRNAMTCCEDDIRFVGYLCHADFMDELKSRQWIYLTAQIRYEYVEEYREEGPVLYGISYEMAQPPKEDLVYFN